MARLRIVALALALLLGLTATGATIWSRMSADTTTKVDVNEVARDARSHSTKHQARGLRPFPGTYTYRVSGTERVTALGGAEHSFGPEAPAVVELLGTGCKWSIHLIWAKEHDVTSTYCTDADGTRLLETDSIVKFFGHEEVVDQPCAGSATWLTRTDPAAATKLAAFTCKNAQRTTIHHPVQGGANAPSIAGIDPSTLTKVTDSIVVGGTAKGTNPIVAWYAKSGLPVQIHEVSKVSSPSILGDTDYSLDIKAELVSTTPK
jgi:hypothetical protein